MIYRFTIISDEVDDFVREIQIDPEATFFDKIVNFIRYNSKSVYHNMTILSEKYKLTRKLLSLTSMRQY